MSGTGVNVASRNLYSLIYLILIAGLFMTVTNLVYISAIPSLVFLLFSLPLILYIHRSAVNKITFFALLFYLLSILGVITYRPESLIHFNFFRYDGNFIVSYAPFLFLPFLCHHYSVDKTIRMFVYFAVLINIPAYLYFFLIWNPYYMTLFSSTNAAGGFYSIVAAMLLALLVHSRKPLVAVMFGFIMLLLLATSSRGSLLGLIAGVTIWWLWQRGFRHVATLAITIIVITQSILIISFYRYYEAGTTISEYQRYESTSYMATKTANIYARLIRDWPRGVDTFSRSPIVGYGLGSINDKPFNNAGILPGLLERNDPQSIRLDAAHAHHSYLHILGEQGILGLLIVVLLWRSIYRYLLDSDAVPWVRDGLLISFWTIIIASFTEHRLTTPAMVLPFSLMFLVYYGRYGNRRCTTTASTIQEKHTA
jgi:O-antigen ligase